MRIPPRSVWAPTFTTLGVLAVLVLVSASPAPALAGEIKEPGTGIVFADPIQMPGHERNITLRATGVALREATFLKVNVYAVVSYLDALVPLGKDPARTVIETDAAKQIHMKFVRDVEIKKVLDAYRDGIKKNFGDDTGEFASDFQVFLDFFTQDVVDGDEMTIAYEPSRGLWATFRDQEMDPIANPALGRAVWSIWFGKKPVSKGMKKRMLGEEG